ncbi:MAG TPA: choice-of-anchor tandem repeat GloVer-containing protein [Fimbriimonadaceae bacterium]|jgi:hypothetical protein
MLETPSFRAKSLLIGLLTCVIACGTVHAQTYTDLHDFQGTTINADGKSGPDGYYVSGGVTFDSAGNMYGTAGSGGAYDDGNGGGMVWEITAQGKYVDLHDFGGTVLNADGKSGPDGFGPLAGVSLDASGNLYGTAGQGGATSAGMVWQISALGKYLDLHDFGGSVINTSGVSGPDGSNPWATVTVDSHKNLFGTTQGGGAHSNGGIIWEITATGNYLDLHDFGGTITNADDVSGPDGRGPYAGVTIDSAGNLYGTTPVGGPYKPPHGNLTGGIVWELTAEGKYVDLHDFAGTVTNANGTSGLDGYGAGGNVTLDNENDLFGAAAFGGPTTSPLGGSPGGMVWEITTKGQYKDIHDFGGSTITANGKTGPDGWYPTYPTLVFDSAGNLYGTTSQGGAHESPMDNTDGVVWEITAAGNYLDLHDFAGTIINANGNSGRDGFGPYPGVTLHGNGKIYGTTLEGGANSAGANSYTIAGGIIWELSLPTVAFASPTVTGGSPVQGMVTLTSPATASTTISLSSSSTDATVPLSVSIGSGGSSAIFNVTTAAVSTPVNAIVTAAIGNLVVSGVLVVNPPSVTKLGFAPASITGGASTALDVYINSAAGASGDVVSLTASSTDAIIPKTVTVPAGKTGIAVTVGSKPVSATEVITITATAATISKQAALTLTPAYAEIVSVSPPAVAGGGNTTLTVTLYGVAGPSGIVVKLSSSSADVKVPATLAVPAGKRTATLVLSTNFVTANENVTITASTTTASVQTTLTLVPVAVSRIVSVPASVTGGASSALYIYLNGSAGSSGETVHLASSSTDAITSTTVTVPAGKPGTIYTYATKPVSAAETITLTATTEATSMQTTLAITPAYAEQLTVSPSSIVGGKTTTLTVTLYGVAGPKGITVSLTSSSPNVKVPATLLVPAGTRTASLTLNTTAVSATQGVTLTAKTGSASVQAVLTLTSAVN